MCCGSYSTSSNYISSRHVFVDLILKLTILLRSLATDKLSCDIHPRKIIKMVRRVSRYHVIIPNSLTDMHDFNTISSFMGNVYTVLDLSKTMNLNLVEDRDELLCFTPHRDLWFNGITYCITNLPTLLQTECVSIHASYTPIFDLCVCYVQHFFPHPLSPSAEQQRKKTLK